MDKKVDENEYSLENNYAFLFILLCYYTFVAYKSSGYHQEDEHYQIIEFANYKLGLLRPERLAWEFNAQIRPGLQPLLCYIFLGILRSLGITDGYTLAFILRVITAVFSIMVLRKFISIFKMELLPKFRLWFILSCYFLWFLPYIFIRFSSETWSGLFLLLALVQVKLITEYSCKYRTALLGIVLGVSILLRYQSGLAVAGILFWLFMVNRMKWRMFLVLMLSITFIVVIGMVVDVWLYGELVFTLFNYFWVNIVQGVSANFGVSPWYEYLIDVLLDPGVFGIFIIASFIYLICLKPKHIIIWMVVPFIVIHSLIPHKELRFLFPLAGLVPLICFTALQDAVQRLTLNKYSFHTSRAFVFVVIGFLTIINVAGLLCISLTGAGVNRIPVAEYINRNYDPEFTRIIISGDINPYMDWGPPKNSYYSSSGLDVQWVDNIWRNEFKSLLVPNKSNLLVIAEADSKGPLTNKFLEQNGFRKVYQNIPNIVKFIYDVYDPSLLNRSWEVYKFSN